MAKILASQAAGTVSAMTLLKAKSTKVAVTAVTSISIRMRRT